MSLRPRGEKKPPVGPSRALVGSISGPAIDLKPANVTVQDVGMKLINDNKPGAYFVTEVYFGPIRGDNIAVATPSYSDQKYLRFRLNLIKSRSGRRQFAKRIEANVKPLLGTGFGDPKHTDSYVCGSPANSFYVLSFLEKRGSESTFTFDPKELAKAITGVSEDENFKIDSDDYTYSITGQGSNFSMFVKQTGSL